MPKISIVMSCYNEEEHVQRAMDSILNQSFTDFEFVIVDDGSQDDTVQIIQSSAASDERIKLVINNKNLGLAASLNKGINLAIGKYIARMDADDVSMPNRLENQVTFLENNPKIDILGSNAEMKSNDKFLVSNLPLNHPEIKNSIFSKTCIIHPSVMLRHSCFENDGYDSGLPWAEDKDLWLRWIDQFSFANLADVLIQYSVKEKITWKIFYYNHLVLIKNMLRQNVFFSKSPLLIKSMGSHLLKMMRQ